MSPWSTTQFQQTRNGGIISGGYFLKVGWISEPKELKNFLIEAQRRKVSTQNLRTLKYHGQIHKKLNILVASSDSYSYSSKIQIVSRRTNPHLQNNH